MDTASQVAMSIEKNNYQNSTSTLTNHPAHLWIGKPLQLTLKAENQLQAFFCKKNGCLTCASCQQIKERQHSFVLWLSPEKNYTLEQIEPIFKTASFALQPDQSYFFVLEKADYLNQACANALLKLLEEPPQGYHFILLAERAEYILPTIRSRCLLREIKSSLEAEEVQLVSWFKNLNLPDPMTYAQTIDQSTLHERESLELIDDILNFWIKQYQLATQQEEKQLAEKIITLLATALEYAPMPGSSKIFWKDLYLKVLFL
jgi:DNA polymerase-3 subunit delta'